MRGSVRRSSYYLFFARLSRYNTRPSSSLHTARFFVGLYRAPTTFYSLLASPSSSRSLILPTTIDAKLAAVEKSLGGDDTGA